MSREIPSLFAPSAPGKAQYGDTNFELLDRLIEVVTAQAFAQAICDRVLEPLHLTSTWLFTDQNLDRYAEQATILNASTPVTAPNTNASTSATRTYFSTAT